MDVTCERCGTEYEFDETLLSARGTSVKCTNCEHVFKVYPRARDDADRTTSNWRLRLSNGAVDTIASLRELQRRISAGELRPDDQIARGEEDWKTLGSIPELDTFFEAAATEIPRDAQGPAYPAASPYHTNANPPPGRPRQPTLLGVAAVPSGQPVTSPGPTGHGPLTIDAELPPSGSAPDPGPVEDVVPGFDPVFAEPAYSAETRAADAPVDVWATSAAADEIEDAELEPFVPPRGRSTPPPAYYDDDDMPELPSRGWSPTRWLALVVLLGAVTLVATQWERVAALLGIGPAPTTVVDQVQAGDDALAEGYLEAYQRAVVSYQQALDDGAGANLLLAKLSNAHALAAQSIMDSTDESRGGGAAASQAHAAEALALARRALVEDPDSLEARIAEADALRLEGDAVGARQSLERARLLAFSRSAEFFRVDALLSAAESPEDAEAGLRSAVQASQLEPQSIRYALLRARQELAAGDPSAARAEANRVLAVVANHPGALALIANLEAAPPAAPEDPDAAALAEAGEEPAVAESPSAEAEEATPEPKTPAEEPDQPVPASDVTEAPAEAKPSDAVAEVEAPAEPVVEPPSSEETTKPAASERSRPKRGVIGYDDYDEYDQLAEGGDPDAFVDGRPPVREYDWYMRQGEAELAGGNYVRARALFESALETQPGSGDATDGLGRVEFAARNYDTAARYYRTAAQRGHPDGYYNLGVTYERQGMTQEAISAYYTYIKRRPSGLHVPDARASIQRLDPRVKLPETP